MMMNQVLRLSSRLMGRHRIQKPLRLVNANNTFRGLSTAEAQTYEDITIVRDSFVQHQQHHPKIINNGTAISVNFDSSQRRSATNDDEEISSSSSCFHAPWLWYSDPTYIHPSSGQRLRRLGQFPGWRIASVEKVDLETALTEETSSSCTFPHPAPPPGCLHSIGTVFNNNKNTKRSSQQHRRDGSDSLENTYLLKVTWDTTTCGEDEDDIGASSSNKNNNKNSNNNKTVVSYYDWNWLQRCRYDDNARRERVQKTRITSQNALGRHPHCATIEEVDYEDLFASEDAPFTSARRDTLLRILHAIAEQGAVLIRGAPLGTFLDYAPTNNDDNDDDHQAAVAKVGRALSGGALSHGALYGDLFHVRSMPRAQNIAYTTMPLSPHQDLAYFESKPGMQLLHCIRNHQDQIRGGESVLIDAIAAAESLRIMEPQYFQTLCRCYATFHKMRDGADMVYNRPHIVLGDMGQVVAVHWSPPFEAPPSAIPQDQMEDYLEAYTAFERMLDDQLLTSSSSSSSSSSCALLPPEVDARLHQYAQDYAWERSLEPGDILVFNNQRMLHGRRGFELLYPDDEKQQQTVHRHLAGCYTNIDDTINTYRVLLHDLPDREKRVIRGFGNGSGGSL